MAKKKDLKTLGDVYSKLGKEEVVVEEKNDMTVGDESATVGEAPLEDGGAKDDAELETPEEVDTTSAEEVQEVKEEDEEVQEEAHCSDEEKEEEGEHEEDKDEEEEEDSEEVAEEDEENALETAQAGINNFMAKKSAFDELYSKVISEDFGMEEQDDLNALGIEDATPDADLEGDDTEEEVAGEEEVTVTLDKEMAKALCDLLKAAMGEEEAADEDAPEADDAEEAGEHAEEDNEGELKAHTAHVDMGENNKVGHVDGLGGEGKGSADGGKSADQSKLGDTVKNDQKVGATTEGPTTTVEPKNKEVKAG